MTDLCEHAPTRRALLGTAGALFAWSLMPRMASAAGARDSRFVCIVLRGAMDGLSAVAPVGDPAYGPLRESIALNGETGAPSLDGFFALHPAMPNLARLYRGGQASVIHAVATGYRERSHFDGQDVLESGQPGPGRTQSGWLNRLAQALPAGERVRPSGGAGGADLLGVGVTPPLVVRGQAPVYGWAPPMIARANDETVRRVLDLYAARDPLLASRLREGLDTERLASTQGGAMKMQGNAGTPDGMRRIAEGAARLLATDDGPRLAALAFDGWDTHAQEGGATGRLAKLLGGLDDALSAFETGLGPRWRDTAILVVTEFGRTARVNGTVGTDHGTGTVAFLAGGRVKGGRVVADWPGLSAQALYEGRDLAPTTDLRGVMKGLFEEMFSVSDATLSRDVFPGTAGIRPLRGLLA
ncbi:MULTISPECIES: DUF1501 domain-containing protein [Methylobacterium]|uniref:DUF1501 domain-containing protein n=1 Tax=Methylobacterium jeotgali TaxID=381630 RepID=A0ABQ4SWR1_9HYPH|nr:MULTISPECIES: DUF1501 domain-containing protein [Methylobacterium]PIU06274.1 MAG: hypothetical protein COT56_10675 [Methylobacterium sp. CG09_land_8_20_14_0_10_71_15]PIU11175.1 MAG: hypothetical protein COT28_21420 [Methylobacterium sp. CG08_land_8_20_14_0_20_71_15]GBU19562.1 hypothetical protein AwMethylo_37770 [Methylobacterium sp.]GJE07542.1 hypothetical protein AOPFMNJM_2871 [Methylobacterium jeotgali]